MKERGKIYLIDGSTAVTGAFISARETARALRGTAEVVLVLPAAACIEEAALTDFAAVRRIAIRPLRRSAVDILLYLPCLLWAAIQLRYFLWRDRASALFVNDFYLVQGALARAAGFRGEILTWVRIDPAAFGRVSAIWLRLSQIASDRIVAVSKHIQGLLPPWMDSALVYDPVSEEFMQPAEPGPDGGCCFVYLGNYIPGKGQDIAVTALQKVTAACPDARIAFFGGDMGLEKNRAYRCSLEALAQELQVADAVTFGDFLSSPRTAFTGKLAALNFSQSESFSRTVLEASASGLPVIATRSGGPEEIIEDRETGLLVPLNDAAACADAMIELCNGGEAAVRMGQAGRDRVMNLFSLEAFRSRLLAVLGGRG